MELTQFLEKKLKGSSLDIKEFSKLIFGHLTEDWQQLQLLKVLTEQDLLPKDIAVDQEYWVDQYVLNSWAFDTAATKAIGLINADGLIKVRIKTINVYKGNSLEVSYKAIKKAGGNPEWLVTDISQISTRKKHCDFPFEDFGSMD